MAPIPLAEAIAVIALELAPPPEPWSGNGPVMVPLPAPEEQDGPDPEFPRVEAVVSPLPALLQAARRFDASDDVTGFVARQNARKANAAAQFHAHHAPRL